jgi:hypothetical protein
VSIALEAAHCVPLGAGSDFGFGLGLAGTPANAPLGSGPGPLRYLTMAGLSELVQKGDQVSMCVSVCVGVESRFVLFCLCRTDLVEPPEVPLSESPIIAASRGR